MVKDKSKIKIGLTLIVVAALLSAVSQLILKFGTNINGTWSVVLYGIGFLVSAMGAVLMMTSFRYGEVSILQPIMSVAYVFSFIFGFFFLGEPISQTKIIGTLLIIAGSVVMGLPSKERIER